MNTNPQNPYTTEGMPASNWIAGLTKFLSVTGANSAKKILQQMAIGTPKIAAPRVTDTEPIIIGKIPKAPWLGAHFIPKTKLKKPTLAIIGTPSTKINTVMSARAERAEKAIRRNTGPDTFSQRVFNSAHLLLMGSAPP
jgi:hypothetical protein